MSTEQCPKCNSKNIYFDGMIWTCPDCFHEWNEQDLSQSAAQQDDAVKDVNGNILQDGDTVTVVKELKVKGSSSAIKIGTKVKNIRLRESNDGHNISCKIEGFGAMNIKSEFVKKS